VLNETQRVLDILACVEAQLGEIKQHNLRLETELHVIPELSCHTYKRVAWPSFRCRFHGIQFYYATVGQGHVR
jgi:hypothetical protein